MSGNSMKGYKQTEVGVIPEEWEVKKIGAFTDACSGGTPSTLVKDYWNGEIRWMNSGELNLKKVYEVENRITELGLTYSATKLIPQNCVLIGLAGQGKTRGTVAINKIELCTNQSIAAIFPCESVDYNFLYFNLDSRYFELRGLSTGDGGRGGLNLTIIKNLLVPVPPTKSEQTAIATALSDADALITSLEKLIEKKRAIKQGAMQELLKPKEGWEVKKLGEIILLKNGYAFSSEFFSNSGPIVITPGNFKLDGGLLFNDRNTLRYSGNITKEMQFQNGDLLIVMTDLTPSCNLLGKPGIVNSEEIILHNQRIGKITIKNKQVNQNYIYWFLASELFSKRMKETATGSTVRHTSVGSINSTIISIPPFEEQTRIATILSDMHAEIAALEQKLAKYKQLKQGMMQELLTGRIRLVENV